MCTDNRASTRVPAYMHVCDACFYRNADTFAPLCLNCCCAHARCLDEYASVRCYCCCFAFSLCCRSVLVYTCFPLGAAETSQRLRWIKTNSRKKTLSHTTVSGWMIDTHSKPGLLKAWHQTAALQTQTATFHSGHSRYSSFTCNAPRIPPPFLPPPLLWQSNRDVSFGALFPFPFFLSTLVSTQALHASWSSRCFPKRTGPIRRSTLPPGWDARQPKKKRGTLLQLIISDYQSQGWGQLHFPKYWNKPWPWPWPWPWTNRLCYERTSCKVINE